MSLDQAMAEGVFTLFPAGPVMSPLEYDGYAPEVLATKRTASLGTSLNGNSPVYDVVGPDALEFLRSVCVNSFRNFEVGQIRHGILCDEQGRILADGVIARIEEDVYRTYWLAPAIAYRLEQSGLDVHGEDRTFSEFFFQIAGPRSLEILEAASGDDLHDIRFARHRMSAIAGAPVRVLRLGMAGGLAYEVHGDPADAEAVYRAIWEAGQPYGMVKQGRMSYVMQHTEAGFPNINMHYPMPWYEDEGLGAFYDQHPMHNFYNKYRELVGSVGDDLQARYVTPFQVGWGGLVDFGHDFIGRQALQREAEQDRWAAVTLVWDADDVADIVASQYRGEDVEPYDAIEERAVDIYFNMTTRRGFVYHADWVLDADGQRIGTSAVRIKSVHYRRMISLGFIDRRHAAEGTQLAVLWGRPGTPQKRVRVTVARLPYYDLPNNNAIDVESIPRQA